MSWCQRLLVAELFTPLNLLAIPDFCRFYESCTASQSKSSQRARRPPSAVDERCLTHAKSPQPHNFHNFTNAHALSHQFAIEPQPAGAL
jgi:hypothetical protein